MYSTRPIQSLISAIAFGLVGHAFAEQPGLGDVFVCVDGQFMTHRVSTTQQANLPQLVRSGRATWFPSVLDENTSYAMSEGLGLWRSVRQTAIFESLGVKTPPSVLAAIAIRESGRKGWYWPWTINHAGRSHFLKSKVEAVELANDLLARGRSDFDVGLMQVNWHWNGARFSGVSAAFDPVNNILIADSIVQEHLRATGSLSEAVGRYHSKTPSLKSRYLQLVNQSHQAIGRFVEPPLNALCQQG